MYTKMYKKLSNFNGEIVYKIHLIQSKIIIIIFIGGWVNIFKLFEPVISLNVLVTF